ncbi:NAD(P)/FAD-dependent oxidoreductase [Streptomyces sp. TG1A-8]|uniref:flavin-containing monooxygenase n=1 Tax=Streptomyces sp. TG1A-8 TaxID=3051385 RepID=UPI00265C24FF|nr:NAD(P)/FAD-dependent oxidoreductase [Streptomyces sp. TG1A-8]MDO0924259.1 NAD(P)/FAD-dependent oxidoreductase [Streptomyces sp. TG1A-8]
MSEDYEVVIIGAGMSGLGMAARLKEAGRHAFTVLEKAASVGGTWRENTYPGAACDVRSHLYWYSFGEQPDWSHIYAGQPEILRNLERFTEAHGLGEYIRFGTEVTQASWSSGEGVWVLHTARGEEVRARVLVAAWGQLNRPAPARVEGVDTFTGVQVHTARWPEDLDVTGKRVACIGSAASAVQLVPAIAPATERLTVFQRSPNYLIARQDRVLTDEERASLLAEPDRYQAMRDAMYHERDGWVVALSNDANPVRGEFLRAARELLEAQVPDEGLRKVLTPGYAFGCKRVLISDDYYPALGRDNVELVTEPITRIEPEGIRTADGRLHDVDVIVHATGFEPLDRTGGVDVVGRDLRSLREVWKEGPQAYLGMAVNGFPNMFMLYGPNTNVGHHSILFMVECQIAYVLQALEALDAVPSGRVDVDPEVQGRYNEELQRKLADTAFSAGCASWYKTQDGKVVNNWPSSIEEYRERTAVFVPQDYALE